MYPYVSLDDQKTLPTDPLIARWMSVESVLAALQNTDLRKKDAFVDGIGDLLEPMNIIFDLGDLAT